MKVTINFADGNPEFWEMPVLPVRGDAIKNRRGELFVVQGRQFENGTVAVFTATVDEAKKQGLADWFKVISPDQN